MFKQRFWLMVGMGLLYFAIYMLFGVVAGSLLGGSMMAMTGAASGFDSPGAGLAGLGIGMILLMIVMYLGYFVILFAQQCAMTELATPLRRVRFGDALTGGLKGGLTFLGIVVLGILAYILFAIVSALLVGMMSLLGDVGAVLSVLLFLVILPLAIYVGLRLMVIVPVVAVDRVFNPITAITRSWEITRGHVLSAFVVYLVIIGVALALLVIPIVMIFGAIAGAASTGDPSAAIASAIGALLLSIPLFLLYTIASIVIVASFHAELVGPATDELEDAFA